MTREEQIYKKAEGDCIAMLESIEKGDIIKGSICPQSYRAGFMDGAKWADSHPHWIPVEERLPPFDCIEDGSCRCSQPVLIYDPIRAWIYVGRYESDDLYGNTYWVYGNGKRPTREVCGGYEIDNVTHWMPLPTPPRKEE